MSPRFRVWADPGWWLTGQKCCYFRVRPRHMATCLWLSVLSPLLCTYPSSHLQTLIFHPQNNLSFLFWANSRFGSSHSSSCGQLCVSECVRVCAWVCVLNPHVPAQSAATTTNTLLPCFHELTRVIFNHVLWCDFMGHCTGTHTKPAGTQILIKINIWWVVPTNCEKI